MKTIHIYIGKKKISCINKKSTQDDSSVQTIDPAHNSSEMIQVKLFRFLNSNSQNEMHYLGSSRSLLNCMLSFFPLIEAAGGVILNKSGKTLFIYRRGSWDLPKGKMDPGETPRKTAVRECEEECAVNGLKIEKKISDTWHMYAIEGKWVLKKTYWYLMKTDFRGKLVPQRAEGIRKAEWVPKSKIPLILKKTYPALTEMLRDFFHNKKLKK